MKKTDEQSEVGVDVLVVPSPFLPWKCSECGTDKEEDEVVSGFATVWTAWGRGAGHLAWQKYTDFKRLCASCEDEAWIICSCGAYVENYYYGTGYLPDDYDGEHLCPECAEKAGYERTVGIGTPPW